MIVIKPSDSVVHDSDEIITTALMHPIIDHQRKTILLQHL